MQKNEKGPFMEFGRSCETGIFHFTIDEGLEILSAKKRKKLNPSHKITIKGAQESSPPFDTYREEIDTSLIFDYQGRVLKLGSPIILGSDEELSDKVYEALFEGLNHIGSGPKGKKYAIIAPKIPEQYRKREFAVFLDYDLGHRDDFEFADGFVLSYDKLSYKQTMDELKTYHKPMLVTTQDPKDISTILREGADGVIVDLSGKPINQLEKIIAAKISSPSSIVKWNMPVSHDLPNSINGPFSFFCILSRSGYIIIDNL